MNDHEYIVGNDWQIFVDLFCHRLGVSLCKNAMLLQKCRAGGGQLLLPVDLCRFDME